MLAPTRYRLLASAAVGSPGGGKRRPPPRCILVQFNSNDLRLHDHYALTLASARAAQLSVPLCAVYCFDLRLFAQPSLLCGFYRQSPLRAQFLTQCVQDVRRSLRGHRSDLVVRVGKPEECIPALCAELGGDVEVYATSQYAPHESMVQAAIEEALSTTTTTTSTAQEVRPVSALRTVSQTTLLHVDDMPTPPEAMRENLRHFIDEADLVEIRPTAPFNGKDGRLAALSVPPLVSNGTVARGEIPSLEDLGYGNLETYRAQGMNPAAGGGESGAVDRLEEWLTLSNLSVYAPQAGHGKVRRHVIDGERLSQLSPYISVGALSPRLFVEHLLKFDYENSHTGLSTTPIREAMVRLYQRDYWHRMGLKHGRRLFFPFGPRPEDTDGIPDYRMDRGVISKWCAGLTGIPFVDAGMKELTTTGWAANATRAAMAWTIAVGFGQDWRAGAEWFERNSLDYDPFICYGAFALHVGLIKDRFGSYLQTGPQYATMADSSGVYTRRWLQQLGRVPNVYLHRPHVMSERMQKIYGVHLGVNYPYPLKLWRGAHQELRTGGLPTYFAGGEGLLQPGLLEAEKFNSTTLLSREDVHPCVTDVGVAAALAVAPATTPEEEALLLVGSRRRGENPLKLKTLSAQGG